VLRLETLQVVEQAPELGRDELLVGDPADRRELLGADGGAPRGHHRLLVPAEQGG
jgi:hypothetical protein